MFIFVGQVVGQFVDSLRYKPETRWFVSLPVGYWHFHLLNPSGRAMVPGVDSAPKYEGHENFLLVNAADVRLIASPF